MTIIKATILAGLLVSLAGCVVPFGKSTGPDDNRAPYIGNPGIENDTLEPTEELRATHGQD